MQSWKRNFYLLWIGLFLNIVSMSMLLPVLPIILIEFGIPEGKELTNWTGITFSITFLVAAVTSPLWGALADKYGQKKNLIRTGIGMAILTILMGFSNSAMELVILRVLMGLFAGYQAITIAYQSTITPKEKLGATLGSLATSSAAAGIIGPLIGGTLAELFGIDMMFVIMGVVSFISIIPIALFLHEAAPSKKSTKNGTDAVSFKDIVKSRQITTVFFATFIYRVVFMGAATIMTLFVMKINTDIDNLVITISIATSIYGIASLIGAPILGKVSDRIGHEKMLSLSLILSGVTLVPLFFVETIEMLYLFRILQGFISAGFSPGINATLKNNTDERLFGRASGLNQSFIFLGNVFGPIVAGIIAGYSLTATYFLLGALCIFVGIIVRGVYTKKGNTKQSVIADFKTELS